MPKTDTDTMHLAPFPASDLDVPARARSVLIVDDENAVRDLMKRWLESGGYSVTSASNAEEALGRLETAAPPAVALCDIRMPGRDGLWLAERIRQRYPETAVIMATGVQDVGPAVESLRQGVIDYLTKPFGRDRLREAVLRGLEWHRAAWDVRRWRESLELELQIRRSRLSDAVSGLLVDSDEGLDAMLAMLTLTDRDAYSHAYRVAALSLSMARVLGLDEAGLVQVEHAALMHDVGKLAMPDAIMRKPAPLTPEELALVRLHPTIAAELAAQVAYLAPSADIIRDVHERMDGLGYPRGVPAAGVALGSRIVSLADTYDTMTRARVFRDAIPPGDAVLELARCSGTQFDPAVLDAFRRVIAAQ
jgi:response regulator RpfG family c-di-GMP phosphodiesterase